MYLNTRTKADYIREKIQEIGGWRSYKEWSEILNAKEYEIRNALYHHPKLRTRYIYLTRNRSVWRWDIDHIRKVMEETFAERGILTAKEWGKVLGFTPEQFRSIISNNPDLKKYYTVQHEIRKKELIEAIEKHWFGSPRFLSDWVHLTGYSSSSIRNWQDELNEYFGTDIFVYETDWRIQEIKNHPQEKTLTEWSKYFDLEISAMHHFFTRKNLHPYRKNCPKKYLA